MNIDVLGSQSATHFSIPIANNLTSEGIAAYILKEIINSIKGTIVDENNIIVTNESGLPITFDNSKYYPEMPLFIWRELIVNGYIECQIVFLHRTPYAD